MQTRKTRSDKTKLNGVHYTPDSLAVFLAEQTVAAAKIPSGLIRVLDPACGDGGLLRAISKAVPTAVRLRLCLEGYETDPEAIGMAKATLHDAGVAEIDLHNRDFLTEEGLFQIGEDGLFGVESVPPRYDLVIANPPYVRTQVMGAKKAKALASKFGLTGRVDLYHAFAMGMADVLKPGGTLGLLTSNRFLTIKSGASLRGLFTTYFDLESIYDLGDTKLFTAAVLPAILIGRKGKPSGTACAFHRIYESRNGQSNEHHKRDSVLEAVRESDLKGVVETPSGTFCIERGRLAVDVETWSLASTDVNGWLDIVRQKQAATFGDVGKVKVGIKTTADEVFVRKNWEGLPADVQPEAAMLRPLLTHHVSEKWFARPAQKQVLYPHVMKGEAGSYGL